MVSLRFGVSVPNVGDLDALVALGVEADRAGWDGFFLWDHMAFTREFPVPVFDPWVTLGALAVQTERIRLGTMVTPLARRRPWKLARETVTLDHLSGGRLILGVGLGTPRDADFELLGEDPNERVRAEKLDEGLELLVRLWGGEPVEFAGKHFRVRDTRFGPVPLQRPRIPIWVGGGWPHPGPLRRAAHWDGVYPLKLDRADGPEDLTADELRQAVAFVRERRPAGEPFAVVAGGRSVEAAHLAALEAAGATWYFPRAAEGPGWEDPTMELLRAGPPR